jgi:very-short-patch-repair endonuclease
MKDKYLYEKGYKVFRFTDKAILSDVAWCVDQAVPRGYKSKT